MTIWLWDQFVDATQIIITENKSNKSVCKAKLINQSVNYVYLFLLDCSYATHNMHWIVSIIVHLIQPIIHQGPSKPHKIIQ